MVKTLRSTSTLFHQWSSACPLEKDKHRDRERPPASPSPSQLDPFESSTSPPSPTTCTRPPSTVVTPTTATAPRIILASPSTSTIHYLFPSDSNRQSSHLAVSPTSSSFSLSDRGGNDKKFSPPLARASFEQTEAEKSAERKQFETAFPLPPTRDRNSRGNSLAGKGVPSGKILGPAKRIPSAGTDVSRKESVKKSPSQSALVAESSIPIKADMKTLRRQPSMADLGGRGRGLRVDVDVAKKDYQAKEKEKEKKSITLRHMEKKGKDAIRRLERPLEPLDPKTSNMVTRPAPASPARKRSLSLISPRAATTPPLPSPILPTPDLGGPLQLTDVIPLSPSFSHLDYSQAGSTAPSSRRMSISTPSFKRETHQLQPIVFPLALQGGIAMSRGDTRIGLGDYASGKVKARQDAASRAAKPSLPGSIKRSISFRKKRVAEEEKSSKPRPRSQSFGGKSIRELGLSISSPVPIPIPTSTQLEYQKRSRMDRGIYLGDSSVDLGGRYRSSKHSDQSSPYPESTPTTGYMSLSEEVDHGPRRGAKDIKIDGKPIHPDMSEISILAPSTIGLGFSPLQTPISLPESLEAEVIELAERGRKLVSPASIAPPRRPVETERGPTKPDLIAQNTFYLPPLHPKPSIRSSSGMRRAATSMNLHHESSEARPAPGRNTFSPTLPSHGRRPMTAFLCSPPNAIDPLPPLPASPDVGTPSKHSSPFLTASASLRGLFSSTKIARSLSLVFEREDKDKLEREKGNEHLKSRISSPLEANTDKLYRESILSQALSTSFHSQLNRLANEGIKEDQGGKLVSSGSKSRMPIPTQLLEDVARVDERELGVRGARKDSCNSLYSNENNGDPNDNDDHDDKLGRSPVILHPTLQETLESRWSPSPQKKSIKWMKGKTPISACRPDPKPQPQTRSRLLSFGRQSPSPTQSPTPSYTTTPISSTSLPPARALLDELVAREEEEAGEKDKERKRTEKLRKVLAWRDEVEDNDSLCKLDTRIAEHLEKERRCLRGIGGKRDSEVD
ncbi:hypothetical protein P7C73_g4146, partial [Tremellales sp. Uapishka_1]